MLCTECKDKSENGICEEGTENFQAEGKSDRDVRETLKAKRSAAVILVSAAAVMLIMVFVLFWFVILPVLPQESSVLADNGVGVYLTDKTDIEINA